MINKNCIMKKDSIFILYIFTDGIQFYSVVDEENDFYSKKGAGN